MKTPIKAIRAKCKECSGDNLREIRFCENLGCPLFEYRFGKNPNRKGIGGRITHKDFILNTQVKNFE